MRVYLNLYGVYVLYTCIGNRRLLLCSYVFIYIYIVCGLMIRLGAAVICVGATDRRGVQVYNNIYDSSEYIYLYSACDSCRYIIYTIRTLCMI